MYGSEMESAVHLHLSIISACLVKLLWLHSLTFKNVTTVLLVVYIPGDNRGYAGSQLGTFED